MKALVVSRSGRRRNWRWVHRRVTMYTRPGTIRRGTDIPSLRPDRRTGAQKSTWVRVRCYNQAFEDSSLHGQPAAIKVRILANADKNVAADQVVDGGVTFTGNELVRDGNRLNVCQVVANGPCPFPYGGTIPPWDGGLQLPDGG